MFISKQRSATTAKTKSTFSDVLEVSSAGIPFSPPMLVKVISGSVFLWVVLPNLVKSTRKATPANTNFFRRIFGVSVWLALVSSLAED